MHNPLLHPPSGQGICSFPFYSSYGSVIQRTPYLFLKHRHFLARKTINSNCLLGGDPSQREMLAWLTEVLLDKMDDWVILDRRFLRLHLQEARGQGHKMTLFRAMSFPGAGFISTAPKHLSGFPQNLPPVTQPLWPQCPGTLRSVCQCPLGI